MTDRPSAEIALIDPIMRTRHRNERHIARLAMLIAAFAGFTAAWRLVATDSGAWGLLGFSILVVAYYAWVYVRLGSGVPESMWKLWVRSTFETSCAFAGMLINLNTVDAVFALSSGTPYIFLFAVALSCLRLDPWLPVYVAVLGAVEQTAIYIWVHDDVNHLLSLSVPIYSFRVVMLLVSGYLGYVLAKTLRSETEKATLETRVRTAFGNYVDRRIVERVLRGDLAVTPERRVVTVMFVDIRDFTQISEKKDPAEVFRMLDGVLDVFAGDVQKQGGIVNKFLGDGLMALFGVPEPQSDHPRRAVRAALRIEESARRMAADGRFPGLRIGIGIHTGEVMAGDIGRRRREYTAIGDVVNVAARVEAANKELGTTILITGDVSALVGPGAELAPKSTISVRGRTRAIEVFEVRGLSGTVEQPSIAEPVGRMPPQD